MGVIIGIFSAKGGVGKSLLTTNLGVAIAAGTNRSALLIDLIPAFGCLDILLDIDPQKSWNDLIPVIGELTKENMTLALTSFKKEIDLLSSPSSLFRTERLNDKRIKQLLSGYKNESDFILVDTVTGLDQISQSVYRVSDIRLIVLTTDVPTIRSTERLLASMSSEDKITGLVINQYSNSSALKPHEIEKISGIDVFSYLPIDPRSVWENRKNGEPCVMNKRSKLGKSITQLAEKLVLELSKLK